MSKEPRQQQQAGTNATTTSSGRPYVTAQNFHLINSRVKPLPPAADLSKLPNNGATTTLFQLKQSVEFRCAHCKRDKIQDDAFALDSQTGRITCQKCFARLIRPRTFKPTRLVPFPSLLSWLNFGGNNNNNTTDSTFTKTGGPNNQDGAETVSTSSSSSTLRMAEAVIPSEARARNNNNFGTDNNNSIAGLISSTPMVGLQQNAAATLASLRMQQLGGQPNITQNINSQNGNNNNNNNATTNQSFSQTHPCASVFNQASCSHGATCFFTKAPGNLCLLYLMGLCTSTTTCPLRRSHQNVFDLPSSSSSERPERWEIVKRTKTSDAALEVQFGQQQQQEEEENVAVESENWKKWVASKKESKNQPEWQLWNQENISGLLDSVLPKPINIEQPQPKKSGITAAAVVGGLNASAIESLLKSMKK